MEEFQELLKLHYHLEPTEIRLLEGYEDRTFLVLTKTDRYILKHQQDTEQLRHRIALENDRNQVAGRTYEAVDGGR